MGVQPLVPDAADACVPVTCIYSYPLHTQGGIQWTMMRRTSVGKYHIRLTLQILTIGSDMVVIELLVPPAMRHTKGLWIPLSGRHNYINIMEMVGPPGLEPGDVG